MILLSFDLNGSCEQICICTRWINLARKREMKGAESTDMKEKSPQRQIERKYEMLMLGADAHTRLNVKQKTWLLKVLVLALILRLQVLGDRGQRAVLPRSQLFLALPGILTLTILTSAVLRLNRDMDLVKHTEAGSCN